MSRTCIVCSHLKRKEIEVALVKGSDSLRDIAGRFGPSRSSLLRHLQDHLPASLLRAKDAQDTARAIDVMGELDECIKQIRLVSEACDRYLRDPDNPDQYDIGPRSHDVQVVYEIEEPAGGDRTRTIRKKAPLSELLARIEGTYSVVTTETKHADPRELILKSYDRLQGRLELIAKLLGQLDDRPQINVTFSTQWVEVRTLIIEALAPYPRAREAVGKALERAP